MRTRSISLLAGGALSTLLALTTVTSSALATDEVIVASGDTLSQIALEHGLTVAQLAAMNGLSDPNRIYVGQRLSLEPAPAPAAAAPPAAPAAVALTHRVAPGENLTTIARRYGTTIAAIVAANAISNPSFIRAGTLLTVGTAPAAGPASAPAAPTAVAREHVVASGETLTAIARRYGTTIAAIVAANAISNPSFIRAGTRLAIPGASPAARPAPATATTGAGMPTSMATLVARRAEIGTIIAQEAQRHGVPIAFAQAVAWQESGWQQGVTSRVGAMGVMQLMPDTVTWVGEAMLGAPVNPHDARQNISAGVRLLRHYLDRYDGDKALVLAAYYQGQRAVDTYGIYAVSRPYIASILVLERIFAGG
ncbi:MAG TPA: LysM peptidoglycan-binding domain-containing protein [Candidatus Limnocylindria bacterium]|nr:LysM peptidoglycan-binding domain-containing protein [Candidatus Limnocylindria bacterium]